MRTFCPCYHTTLTERQLEELEAFRRKQLRSIIGIKYPRRISNSELYERCKSVELEHIIRGARWRMFGHVLRMTDDTRQIRHNTLLRWAQKQFQRQANHYTAGHHQQRPRNRRSTTALELQPTRLTNKIAQPRQLETARDNRKCSTAAANKAASAEIRKKIIIIISNYFKLEIHVRFMWTHTKL